MAAVLLACSVAAAQPAVYGDVTVTPVPHVGAGGKTTTTHGYAEYRFIVTNRSPKDSHRVTLHLPAESDRGGDRIARVSNSLVVGPSAKATIALYQPALPMNGMGAAVEIDGKSQRAIPLDLAVHGQSTVYHRRHIYYTYSSREGAAWVLVSRGAGSDFVQSAGAGAEGSAASQAIELFQGEVEVENWPDNWLGYSRLDGVVLTAGEMGRLPATVRGALVHWVRAGGSLLVLGACQVPNDWQAVRARTDETSLLLERYAVGFGEARVFRAADQGMWSPTGLGAPAWEDLVRSWQASAGPWRERLDIQRANAEFPVVANLGVPIRGMLGLVVAFAVVIGPANIWVLARKRKRIHLLWTVPAISLAACLAVFTYSIFAEGWRGRSRTAGLTVLDERTHQATTIGLAAFYSPLTPGRGLRFEGDTELTPHGIQDYGGGSARTLDFSDGQHLVSGWVRARVPTHFQVRKSQTRRERLNVRRAGDGTLSVVNGLGAEVVRLALVSPEGKLYAAERIPAGAEAALKPLGGRPAPAGPDAPRRLFTQNWAGVLKNIDSAPAGTHLRPGTYLAELNRCPFIETGLSGAEPADARSIVYGILREWPDGSQGR